MKAWIIWPTVVLVACLIVIGFLPVQWLLDKPVPSFGKVNMGAISGNGWQGVVLEDVSVDHRGYRVEAGNISVRYDDISLQTGSICIRAASLTTDSIISGNGIICYHWNEQSWSIYDASIKSSGQLVAELTGIALQGRLLANINHAYISSAYELYGVNGELTWDEAQWFNGEQWIVLGQLFSTVDSIPEHQHSARSSEIKSAPIEINTMDVDSPLEVSMKTIIAMQGVTTIEGYIQPYADVAQSLIDSLQLAASSQQGQRYYYHYQW